MNTALAQILNGWAEGPLRPFWVWLGEVQAPVLASVVIAFLLARAFRSAAPPLHRAIHATAGIVIASIAFGITDPLVSQVLKPAFSIPRPCTVGVTVPPEPLPCGSGLGMPSGHAANTAVVASALGSPVLGAVSVLVGVSRVVNGQHWPSDVLAGWALGTVIGQVLRAIADRVLAKFQR